MPIVSELMKLVQAHLDQYGVKQAEFARRIGSTPQTVANWKKRRTTLPQREHLEGVAEVTGRPYKEVLGAALIDAGYLDSTALADVNYISTQLAGSRDSLDDVADGAGLIEGPGDDRSDLEGGPDFGTDSV